MLSAQCEVRSHLPPTDGCGDINHCRVDAGGVPAEWVEATVATIGQETIVCFLTAHDDPRLFEMARPPIGGLAVTTGARILMVACRRVLPQGLVSDGLATYRWLLFEGCDPSTTTFTDLASGALAADVRRAAAVSGLPLPRTRLMAADSLRPTSV